MVVAAIAARLQLARWLAILGDKWRHKNFFPALFPNENGAVANENVKTLTTLFS
ncbi:MAG: hypothetical protein FWD64_04580 [Acidobacteriaceae bacterium]|nr:hypothetical protein [Acidobacteriaceae bacterium]